jgi:phage terminase large subunit-like protein
MNIELAQLIRYRDNPAEFRDDLLIDVDGVVRRFGDVMDPWQRDDFAALDPGMMRCTGHSVETTAKMRFYGERARGHSKTTDIAVMCTWALAFASRPIKAYAFAADKDQSQLLRQAIDTLVRLNPWLSKLIKLEVQKNCVMNCAGNGHPGTGAILEICTSDVGSSYGLLADLIICDELTHWGGDDSLWHSIISTAAKRSNCLLCIIANAGFVDSWQWSVRETARQHSAWHFSRLDGPVASWLTPDRLDEQRGMLPTIAFQRLWGNCWSSGGGDCLTESDIRSAFIEGLKPMSGSESGYTFLCGVDLALTRDNAAVVVIGVQPGKAGKIRLAHHKLWQPVPGRKIDLLEIERHLVELHNQFDLATIAYDPWQMEHLAQTLRADLGHRDVREVPPTGQTLRDIASLVIESFTDRRVQLFECEPLRRDLKRLRVEERSGGTSWRLTSPKDGDGHGDSFSAFSIALLVASELSGEASVDELDGWFSDDNATDAFTARQEEYEAERQMLSQRDTPNSELRHALSRGDLTIFGSENPFTF